MENPIKTLNNEHDLIYKLLEVFKKKLSEMKETREIDSQFIDVLEDCFENFINRIHHWKEENVLFKELKTKSLSPEHEQEIKRLTSEHEMARKLVNKIVEGRYKFTLGELSGFDELTNALEKFIELYEPHITFENEKFFPEAEIYFDDDEKIGLKAKFNQIDSGSVLQNYSIILQNLERN